MRKYSFPAWLLWFLITLLIVGAIFGAYRIGFRQGDESVACMPPDPDWDSIYFECFEAAYASGVTCPCTEQPIECLDILRTRAFSPYEKFQKVREEFGTNLAITYCKEWNISAPGKQAPLTVDCEPMGVCPAGDCVTWEGACTEKRGDKNMDCCLTVITR
jgi:hypothetical protein